MASLKRTSTGYVSKKFLAPIIIKSDYKKLIGNFEEIPFASTECYVPAMLGMATPSAIGNSWNPEVTEQSYHIGQAELPTYIITSQYRYNELDVENFAMNIPGKSLPELQDELIDLSLGLRVRQLALHGYQANEGLLATSKTVSVSGNWSTMTGSALLSQLLNQVNTMLSSVGNAGKQIVICGSVRLINMINMTLVNTDTYLKSGSTGTSGSILKDVVSSAVGKEVIICIDDTLGHGGVDGKDEKLLITIPELTYENQSGEYEIGMQFGSTVTNTYMGISGQIKKTYPETASGYSGQVRIAVTPGTSLRPQGSVCLTAKWEA